MEDQWKVFEDKGKAGKMRTGCKQSSTKQGILTIHLGVSSKPGGLKALCTAHANLEFSVEFSKSRFVRVPETCAKPEIY
ncbi:hypothetical protein DV515_00013440 [Chloebia gouldiae]|uniref:Uncharacterized protein n=1 Tax=Chloebia gouldiae TaxID=44316 RepID=A0A3L8S0Y9_CHLGU|nr:hypothetical protein DV515_00013440 [Chloebia gouldiae]